MFQPVNPKVDFRELEHDVLGFWKQNKTFEKSMAIREGQPRFVVYEGPPTANGIPHYGHVLTRVFKDIIPRYQTMKGKFVLRKGGWDTHGLPVEIEVEKKLGLKNKQDIERFGIRQFNELCRASVFEYVKMWEDMSDRLGFWFDLDHAYITLDPDYVESVWNILQNFWQRDLLYKGFKVVPYCARCGTALSDHEVAQGYDEAEDPSVYVRFPLRDEPGVSFLVWTTTPWTLPGNVALAVGEDLDYVLVDQNGDRLILAEALLGQALRGDYTVVERMKGRDLLGKHYQSLYQFLPVSQDYAYVVAGDFVSTEDGTGIVHIAPAYGADDMEVGKQYGLPILQTVNPQGQFIAEVTPWAGQWVKAADPHITQDLRQRGLLYQAGTYKHTYPFCWRCHTPLLYYARDSWYVRTTQFKAQLLANNDKINWVPDHIRKGRFGEWLANNVDWALSRDRFWGTPLPIWECDNAACQERVCVGSRAELSQFTGQDLSGLDPHRPNVDEITWPCQCGQGTMRRVPQVIDTWFDSGAMPYAQWHYPFENQARFREQYPADYICEAIDQTRGWFYTLHAEATLLYDSVAFKNCLVLGHVLAEDGTKLSKSKGNYVPPMDIINRYGADPTRWYFFARPAWAPGRFDPNGMSEVIRQFMLTLWNTYSFFVMYANLDGWTPEGDPLAGADLSDLDRWLLAELYDLVQTVDQSLASYDIHVGARAMEQFVDSLSNWYVRRSRRRFWKSGAADDADKRAAYGTLYTALTTFASVLAPYMPFLAETLYQNLVLTVKPDAPESVHLTDWPTLPAAWRNDALLAQMRLTQRLASVGHAARNKAAVKVRQPLAEAIVAVRTPDEAQTVADMADLLADEWNVQRVSSTGEGDLVNYRVRVNPAKLGPKYGKKLQAIRQAVEAADPAALARSQRAGQMVEIAVNGETVALLPEELNVEVTDRPGYTVAEEGGLVVALDTTITEELRRLGLVRELVRRVNAMRKDAGFEIADTVTLYYQAPAEMAVLLTEQAAALQGETLSTALRDAPPPADAYTESFTLEGQPMTVGLVKN
ncbi:MAG: isoleucine--tRNA ligase [Anaerolineae bacterium]|nr:isoleucine--tRNA ligase [Anaerolineae bacterium]